MVGGTLSHKITPSIAGARQSATILATEELVNEVASPETRKRLSESTGIDEKKLLHFLHSIDLIRIKGVGTLYSTLFCEAGVCSVNELAEWEAEKLLNHLNEINGHQELVQHLPSKDQLTNFIEQAKVMPNLVITASELELTEEYTPTPTFWNKYGTSIGMLVFGAVVVGLSMVFRRQIMAAYRSLSFFNQMKKIKGQTSRLIVGKPNFSQRMKKVKKQVNNYLPHDFDKQMKKVRK